MSEETWRRVQEVRAARVASKEKPQQHPHYLKGTVACGHCGELLGIEIVRNGRGVLYPYFYCLGRQRRRTNCDFRAIAISAVEEAVEHHWRTVAIAQSHSDAVRRIVMDYIDTLLPERDKRIRAAERQITQLKDERDVLLRAHYAGAVPLDQLREEQDRIGSALAAAERELSTRRLNRDQLKQSLDRALNLLDQSYEQYIQSSGQERRRLNQALFRQLYIFDDEIADASFSDLFERLLSPELEGLLQEEAASVSLTNGLFRI